MEKPIKLFHKLFDADIKNLFNKCMENSTESFNRRYRYIAIHQGKAWGLATREKGYIFELIANPNFGHSGTHDTAEETIANAITIGAVIIDTQTHRFIKVTKEQKIIYKIIDA